MKTGELLRRTRLERELSIGQVARDLYIQEKYIQALEEGNYEIIPGETYQRAYFRKYAEYLGLAELFERLAKSDTLTDEITVEDEDSVLGGEWDAARWRRVGLKAVLIIIILVFTGLSINKCSGRQAAQLSDPRVDSTQQTLEVVPPDEAFTNWEIPNTSTASPENTPSISGSGAHKLVLTAIGQCWVTLKTRDDTLFNNVMLAGDVREFSNDLGFHLRAGAPENLYVRFDDEDIKWGERQTEMLLPEGFTLSDDQPEPEESTPEEPEDPENVIDTPGTDPPTEG